MPRLKEHNIYTDPSNCALCGKPTKVVGVDLQVYHHDCAVLIGIDHGPVYEKPADVIVNTTKGSRKKK